MQYGAESLAVAPRVGEVADADARVALDSASRPQQQRLLGRRDVSLALDDHVRDL